MSGTELELGAQTRAAQLVADGIPDVMQVVQQLGSALETGMTGFRGGAASGLAEAVTAWFEAAQALGPTLTTYAENLAATDVAAGTTDAGQQDRFTAFDARLGGQ